jgi:serine/threonine-protein kinase ATR
MCACLQSALAQEQLQSLAFSAWETMLTYLEDEDVELMLENTFSIVIQRWGSFDKLTQRKVESTFQYLLKERTELLQSSIINLPSLSDFPLLANIEQQLNDLRPPTDISHTFRAFSRRVSHENSGVVSQALTELKTYLKAHQSFLQASAVSEQPDIVISLLVRSILDTCVKFNEVHHDIALLSAECIGLIGCLDPNRVESVREQPEMVVLTNFVDPGETTDFVLFILQEVIVKAFLSTTDTGVQGFLSYVMQVLLEKCDFKTVCLPVIHGAKQSPSPAIWKKWCSLPPNVQDTLTPFLSSKYSLTEGSMKTKIGYPIFKPKTMRPEKMYLNWLKSIVVDLLLTPLNAHADLIFTPLLRTIKIRDSSIAEFLLPYAVMHVVLEGTDQNRQELGNELLAILAYQITADSSVRREELKMCSEVRFSLHFGHF